MSLTEDNNYTSNIKPIKPNSARTPLQSIAAQIANLPYPQVKRMAKDMHADSPSIGKSWTDIADMVTDWCARELEGKNSDDKSASA